MRGEVIAANMRGEVMAANMRGGGDGGQHAGGRGWRRIVAESAEVSGYAALIRPTLNTLSTFYWSTTTGRAGGQTPEGGPAGERGRLRRIA